MGAGRKIAGIVALGLLVVALGPVAIAMTIPALGRIGCAARADRP